MKNSVIAVIPARYESTRFPGKPLCMIKGKTMIEHVYSRVKKAKVDEVIVATDDKRIFEEVQKFGGKVVMTSKRHKSGTDRIAEAVENLPYDFVLNVQGDAPLISYKVLNQLIELAKKNLDKEMFTVAAPLKDLKDISLNPNVVKVVMDKDNNALYFSRHSIPYNGKKYFRHVGVYLYTKECLKKFVSLKRSELEKSEKLEQLRALENGIAIKILKANSAPPGVNVPEDINKILELMK